MFAIVRTGGKQYRVAAGDKIVVEKLPGAAGDSVQLDDVLLAGEGSDLRSTDGLIVAAEIIAQAKADKVTVFKKRRRHNYRRKRGHRQQHTILRIVSIGGEGKKAKVAAKPAEAKAETPAPEAKAAAPEAKPAKAPKAEAPAAKAAAAAKPKKDDSEAPASKKPRAQAPLKTAGAESEMTDTPAAAKRKPAKPKK